LYLEASEIDKFLKDYDKETRALKDELLRICWYMRGGISYNEAHLLTIDERQLINKLIEDNLTTTKESGLPFF